MLENFYHPVFTFTIWPQQRVFWGERGTKPNHNWGVVVFSLVRVLCMYHVFPSMSIQKRQIVMWSRKVQKNKIPAQNRKKLIFFLLIKWIYLFIFVFSLKWLEKQPYIFFLYFSISCWIHKYLPNTNQLKLWSRFSLRFFYWAMSPLEY